jgi:glyoxylase-like metal-dependent hydrolase (beta-lactamase superfamily II)
MSNSAATALKTAEAIDVNESWFEVLRLPNDVHSIAEPRHWQEVISFLIIGSQNAVLFDTGMGIRDISKVVNQLTDLDVIVVNSHSHFDHVGDDHRFSRIFVYDDELAVKRLVNGMPNEALQFDTRPDAFFDGYPEGFDPKRYSIRPVSGEKISLLHEGDVIDLGNRRLEVLHTPGHTFDSIMLLDRENRSLFTGDTFYPDRLFAFMDEPFGKSDLQVYEQTMRELTKLVPELDYLYCSHTKPLVDPAILHDVAKAFEAVNKGEAQYEDVELYGQELKSYEFDGFAIATG